MAELKKSKLPRKLVVLALLVGCLCFVSQPALAVGGPTGCGDPYYQPRLVCAWWDVYQMFCDIEWDGCADCDQGTYCYPLYE